jgi:hypothetical protein
MTATTATITTAPPPAAASNCSRGGNGEQRDVSTMPLDRRMNDNDAGSDGEDDGGGGK